MLEKLENHCFQQVHPELLQVATDKCMKLSHVFFSAGHSACFYLLDEWLLLRWRSASECDAYLNRRKDTVQFNNQLHL